MVASWMCGGQWGGLGLEGYMCSPTLGCLLLCPCMCNVVVDRGGDFEYRDVRV